MSIRYSDTKQFTPKQLEDLFLSVGWLSGNYPNRLALAMRHSQTVFTAWHGQQLVGLINALDDGALTAYVHYLLVNPAFHGTGIGGQLVARIKEKYKEYLYITLICEDAKNAAFYQRLGFTHQQSAAPMALTNTAIGDSPP